MNNTDEKYWDFYVKNEDISNIKINNIVTIFIDEM